MVNDSLIYSTNWMSFFVPRWHEKCSLVHELGLKNMSWGSVNYQQFPTVSYNLVCLLSRDVSLLSLLAVCSCLSVTIILLTPAVILCCGLIELTFSHKLVYTLECNQNRTTLQDVGVQKCSKQKRPFPTKSPNILLHTRKFGLLQPCVNQPAHMGKISNVNRTWTELIFGTSLYPH